MKKKLAIISLLTLGMAFSLTGCGNVSEEPAQGVSIANAEGQALGFTYLYDLGKGYKLYADNFTKIVYLRYDYEGGKGATSIGSSSLTPYISANGYYYKVNTQTRVIEEYIPNNIVNPNDVSTDISPESETQLDSQKQDIEAILNENGQKNQNSNNQQKQESSNIESQNPKDNVENTDKEPQEGAVSTPVDEEKPVEKPKDENVE